MRKDIATTHFAHICIIPAPAHYYDELALSKKINAKLETLLKHYPSDTTTQPGVQKDEEFRYAFLTGIGLRGTSLEQVSAVATALASWVKKQPELKLAGEPPFEKSSGGLRG